MLKDPIIVLKFGGSVLTSDGRFEDAAREIHRWRTDGWLVIAVVSALAGRTDDLVRRCDASRLAPDAHTRASVLALGERESCALLTLRLHADGVRASGLTPESIGLVAQGNALDADLIGLDTDNLVRTLRSTGVVVVPGFVALDDDGRTLTLGRGGSDLTALFLAERVDARRCRLVKDVDGLYDRDPAHSASARRYEHATYDDALATDGSILQHKAVRFAIAHDLRFEVGNLGGHAPTRIGPERTRLANASTPTGSVHGVQ